MSPVIGFSFDTSSEETTLLTFDVSKLGLSSNSKFEFDTLLKEPTATFELDGFVTL